MKLELEIENIEEKLEILELLFDSMPFIFWKDKQGKYKGANSNEIYNLGFSSPKELIGKTVFEVLEDFHSAKLIDEIDNRVMSEDITLIQEEKIIVPAGEKTYLSQKAPIHNKQGEVIGMLGFSVDITELKRAEEAVERERARLMELAQVAHDIKSPTASLLILIKSCTDIPEKERTALREATMRIQDIANNLLSHYSQKDISTAMSIIEEQEPLLVSVLLASLLSEKKLQYQDLEVKLIDRFSQSGTFTFIQAQASAFKRMISNLINNAVEALDNKAGNVMLRLEADNEQVNIVIEDNGKGMQPELIEKIKNNMTVTEGKQQGYGLGWMQVWETLQRNHGEFLIESQYSIGTKITLTFPRIQAPAWIAETIRLREDSILIILDDDQSIHTAWDSRFESIVTENPNIRLIHFTQGEEALIFIHDLPQSERKKVFLLSDYELLKQSLTGLDVIEESGIKKAVLVTSHYARQDIRECAAKTGTKILPKLLASEIPIVLNKQQKEEEPTGPVEIVIIDDNQALLNVLIYNFSLKNRVAEGFSNPYPFLDRLAEFRKTIKICFDYDFKLLDMDGFALAKRLYEAGYTNLYMLSGMNFTQENMPSYLTIISKDRAINLLELL